MQERELSKLDKAIAWVFWLFVAAWLAAGSIGGLLYLASRLSQ